MTNKAVEKGFSVYIKLCLQHVSRDYFKKLHRDAFHVRPLEKVEGKPNTKHNFSADSQLPIEDLIILSEAIKTLRPSERKVLYLKFMQDQTDKGIAEFLGSTRQAATKLRKKVLLKLKSHLEKQF
ncbi:RNA polymerase sigma-F factor [compost metagenome]